MCLRLPRGTLSSAKPSAHCCTLLLLPLFLLCCSALELGCLTSLTLLKFKRSRVYEQEGWRIIKAKDTLPPNLRVLRVVDCASATPLLRLTQLRKLSIGQHCHMPAAELEQLSVLTQLEAAKLGYDIWRGHGGEREVEKGSAGWGFVPALKELELHVGWDFLVPRFVSHPRHA